MKTIIEYACEGCGTRYNTAHEAEACELSTDTAKAKVGDIVLAGAGFGWFDGDPEWVRNRESVMAREGSKAGCPKGHGNCFDDCCTYSFYYVVTAVTTGADNLGDGQRRNAHRVRYHLATNAMTSKSGYHDGYTYNQGHKPFKVVKDVPAEVKRDAKKLIGDRADTLL